jgi:lipase chaperone LimK
MAPTAARNALLVFAAGLAAWSAATHVATRPATAPAPPRPATTPFAPSLAGTTTAGLVAPAQGDALVPGPGLIELFDHYLATLGERSLDDIRAQIERELEARLAPAAAARAKDVFARYLAFRERLRTADPGRPAGARSVDVLRQRLRVLRAIRAEYFDDAEARALFGPADREAADALARMAIAQDPALDADERRRRLAQLDAAAPDQAREARAAATSITRLEEAARSLREQGGSEDDVWHLRAAATSPEAANRLAELDREEAAWQARIAEYLAQRRTVQDAALGEAQRQEAIAALRGRLFTPAEQRRLGAYEN